MKKKSFLYGMLPIMMAAVLCGMMSSCSSDDPLDGGKDNGVVDDNDGGDDNGANGEDNGDIALWDGLISEEYFPDENFRNYLLEQDYGKDGVITEEEIKSITRIYVYNQEISSLKGIEYFTALETLGCYQNKLTSLDVSKNTALTELYCSFNQLTSLDVSQNTALTSLTCHWNQLTSLDVSNNTALTSLTCQNCSLTSLDVSKNTALTSLYCDHNQLTSLDVSKNTALTSLDCGWNQLTSLDVSKNTALTSLRCYSNQIKGESMDALISSLPQKTSGKAHAFVVYTHHGQEGNVCTKAQVAAAKAKGWTPYYYAEGSWLEYEGSDE